jgi:transcription initiation factor IIE alpha subunit
MVQYTTVCNCGNIVNYQSEATEIKTITCSRCGKQVKFVPNDKGLETYFL